MRVRVRVRPAPPLPGLRSPGQCLPSLRPPGLRLPGLHLPGLRSPGGGLLGLRSLRPHSPGLRSLGLRSLIGSLWGGGLPGGTLPDRGGLLGPCLLGVALALTPPPAVAAPAGLPASAQQTSARSGPGTALLPRAPAREGQVARVEPAGEVRVETYRIEGIATTFDLTRPLRAALEAQGWEIRLDCAEAACGGFDFRFALAVEPEPAMHVDLGDFRYLLAQRGAEWTALLASRRGATGWLQSTEVAPGPAAIPAPPGTGAEAEADATADPASAPAGSLVGQLQDQGHAVLEGLVFASNAAASAEPSPALAELAAFLNADAGRRVLLVGHTDATGSLEANMTVSRRRAEEVRERLIRAHGVNPAQLAAEGVGYLAPRASNASEAGRSRNRRVEAVLLPPS